MKIKVKQTNEIEIEIPKFWKCKGYFFMLIEDGYAQVSPSGWVFIFTQTNPTQYDLEGLEEVSKDDFKNALDQAKIKYTDTFKKMESLCQ